MSIVKIKEPIFRFSDDYVKNLIIDFNEKDEKSIDALWEVINNFDFSSNNCLDYVEFFRDGPYFSYKEYDTVGTRAIKVMEEKFGWIEVGRAIMPFRDSIISRSDSTDFKGIEEYAKSLEKSVKEGILARKRQSYINEVYKLIYNDTIKRGSILGIRYKDKEIEARVVDEYTSITVGDDICNQARRNTIKMRSTEFDSINQTSFVRMHNVLYAYV